MEETRRTEGGNTQQAGTAQHPGHRTHPEGERRMSQEHCTFDAADAHLRTWSKLLKKRDGVDKLLKLLRYGSIIGWWWWAAGSTDVAQRLRKFEKVCSAARKAMRLGKVHNWMVHAD